MGVGTKDGGGRGVGRDGTDAVWQDAELLRAILQNAVDAVVMADRRGVVIAWNRAAKAMFGYAAEEIIGRPLTTLMPERFRAAHRAALHRAAEGAHRLYGRSVELTALRADGREIPIELSLSEHRVGDRVVFTAMIRDIGERVRIQRNLEEQRARLLEAERLGRYGHYVFDVRADRWTSSAGLDAIFGIDATHARTSAGWLELVHPNDREQMGAYLRDHVLGEGRPFLSRYRIVDRHTGETRWVHGVGRLSFGPDGEPTHLIGTIQDVTERVEYERELQALAEERRIRLRELRSMYRLTEELHGLTDLEAILQTAADVIADGWGAPGTAVVHLSFAGREAESTNGPAGAPYLRAELRARGKHGAVEICRIAEPGAGRMLGVEGAEAGEFLEAITNLLAERLEHHLAEAEQAELRAQYHQAQKMEAIGTLAGGIAHDFNNILAAVMGHAELARAELPEGLRHVHEPIEEILSAAGRAKDLVSQILTIARHDAQERRPVVLNSLLREGVRMIRAMIPASIRIETEIGSEPLVVHTDSTRIHQVLLNLAANARDAMGDAGGTLRIGLAPVEGHARITVGDTGRGMDPVLAKRIFEPYFTTKPKGRGTGLGLAVVQSIVASHGGRVEVDTGPGRGTVFALDFPTVEGVERPPSVPVRGEPTPTGTERILFIDDEPAIVRAMRRLLQRLGYTVTTACSAAEALELFRASPGEYDLVLTDLTMPGMSGRELAAEIRELRADVPVILCSGTVDLPDGTGRDSSVDAFVRKPFRIADVGRAVRTVLDRASTAKASADAVPPVRAESEPGRRGGPPPGQSSADPGARRPGRV